MIKATFHRGQHGGKKIRFQPRQDDLCFRITKTAVEFDHLRAMFGEHQPGIEKAAIGPAFRRHPPHNRQHDVLPGLITEGFGQFWGW